MLLLTYGVRDEDRLWFSERNILVYPCGHIANHTSQVLSDAMFVRFFLFHPDLLRHWPVIVYYDVDIIVNMQLACLECNQKKGEMTMEEYLPTAED